MSDKRVARFRGPIAGSLVYAVATVLAFPQRVPGSEHVVDLGLVAAPLAVTALLIALGDRSASAAARIAFGASLVAHVCLFHWFFVVTVVYGGVHPLLGILTPLVPAVFVSLFTMLFASVQAMLRERGSTSPFVIAMLWTALDALRGVFLGGFPWASLGYGQWQNAWLLGLTPWAGFPILGFSVALLGAALARMVVEQRLTRSGALALVSVVMLHLVGAWLAADRDEVAGRAEGIRVAALQGNIDQREKWSPARVNRNLERYLALSRRAVAAGAEIIVWPESAVPGFIELDVTVREPIAALARETGVSFVLGATGAVYDPVSQEFEAIYDSAFVMNGEGRLLDRYDKTQLVPFGEFVPFRTLFGSFVEALARGMAPFDVTRGEAPRALEIPLAGQKDPVRIGVPICYELLFPDLVRRMPADGAQILLGITNDAWYGRTGARDQFLAMTAVRAAETARPLVRVANSGISAIVDARGRIRQQSVLDVQDVLVGDIPLLPRGGAETFYVRYGDVFAWSCAAGVGIALLRRIRQNRGVGRHD